MKFHHSSAALATSLATAKEIHQLFTSATLVTSKEIHHKRQKQQKRGLRRSHSFTSENGNILRQFPIRTGENKPDSENFAAAIDSNDHLSNVAILHAAIDSNDHLSDVGILYFQPSQKANLAALCPQDFVQCIDGYNADDDQETCADACEGECCVGTNACYYFTGSVCKDGVSCSGYNACSYSYIDSVINGCYGGSKACEGADITMVANSCQGPSACDYAGKNSRGIDLIENSCHGDNVCFNAAYVNGSIGIIQDSCQGYRACDSAAFYSGNIGMIQNSCRGDNACDWAASNFGNIGNIVNSCLGEESCLGAASCTTPNVKCRDATGSISSIACACHGVRSCFGAGDNTAIESGITNVCNERSACEYVTENTLPFNLTLLTLPDRCAGSKEREKTVKSAKAGKETKIKKAANIAKMKESGIALMSMSMISGEFSPSFPEGGDVTFDFEGPVN